MKALVDRLGMVDAEKFITLIIKDRFDYTKWQENMFQDMSVEELAIRAKEYRENIMDD